MSGRSGINFHRMHAFPGCSLIVYTKNACKNMNKYFFFLCTICLHRTVTMALHKNCIPGDPFATVHIKNDALSLFYQDQAVVRAALRTNAHAYHIRAKKED